MRIGVIDCGTNTMRLYIADGDESGVVAEVLRRVEYVRLGENVDSTGEFSQAALERTFRVADSFAADIAKLNVERVWFIATSAARDVSNREQFFDGIKARLGVDPDVISGDEEAHLSFLGALSGAAPSSQSDGGKPVLVMDLGGGSTEFILGTGSGTIIKEKSTEMGSVRLRERFLHGDPPSGTQISAAREFVVSMIESTGIPFGDVGSWVGVAGTCTSLSAMHMGLTSYDRTRVHNSTLTHAQISAMADHLLSIPVTQVLEEYPVLNPMRADLIGAGALICAQIAGWVPVSLTVRETDILDGAALRLLKS